jgi:hypothetical protein
MGGTYSAHGRYENAYKMLVGKPEGKRPFGRPRSRWEDNIRVLGKGCVCVCVCVCVNWTHLAQNRDQWRTLVNMIMSLQELNSPASIALGVIRARRQCTSTRC